LTDLKENTFSESIMKVYGIMNYSKGRFKAIQTRLA
jgi:hypothetical protein